MKIPMGKVALCLLSVFIGIAAWAEEPIVTVVPGSMNASNGPALAWPTTPGIRYELQRSTNLNEWTAEDGFPALADISAQEASITLSNNSAYFRVRMLDEQPPEIENRIPGDGSFGVRRYSEVQIRLSDQFAIDPNSLLFTIDGHGSYSIGDPELSFETNFLSFHLGGDTALGGYGATVDVSLVAADVGGNMATNAWSFQLETEAEAATNLSVRAHASPSVFRNRSASASDPNTVVSRFPRHMT
jgi:hypothetical protein